MSVKEFNVLEKLDLPKKLIVKKIDNHFIIVDKTGINWIVFNELEYVLFELLRKNNIQDSLEKFYLKNKNISGEEILNILIKVLKKIEIEKFNENNEVLEQEPIEQIVKSIHLDLTNNCNLECKHCFILSKDKVIKQLDFKKLIEFLEIVIKDYKTEVIISGGEPLLYPHIYDLLEYLKAKEQKIILFTNGLLINENNILKIKDSVVELQTSMEGISRAAYESIRGKDTYDAFIKTLILLKKHNINTSLAITLVEQNITEVAKNIVPFLKKLDHKNLNVRLNDEIEFLGNATSLKNQNFDYNYERKLIVTKIFKDLSKEGYNFSMSSNKGVKILNCGIGTSLTLGYDGKIYPCSRKSKIYYSLDDVLSGKVNIQNELNDLNRNMSVELINKCQDCELKYMCCGGCRLISIEQNDSWFKPICNKEKIYRDMLIEYFQKEDIYE